MDSSSQRTNQPMYAGRTMRRGSVGSANREDVSNAGNGSGSGNNHQMNVFRPGGDSHHSDLLKTIYVSNITSTIPDDSLWEAFGQFGRIESLVRRDVNVDMNNNTEQQYAFIRFRTRQEARYAITTGEINFYGRKLVIRARDKPSYVRPNGNTHDRNRGDFDGFDRRQRQQVHDRRNEHRPQIIDALSIIQNPSAQVAQNTLAPTRVELLSKVLTVANLPADMSPKELYDLYSSYGAVERSYIFQQADPAGRRFGEVTMATFYFAQKAFEGTNSFIIRGIPLDVSYKINSIAQPSIPEPTSPITPRNYAWAIPPMHWPYQMCGPNGQPLNGHSGVQYPQQHSGIVLPYAVWNPGNGNGSPSVNYGYPSVPLQGMPPAAHTIPVCVYPPQVNGSQLQRLFPTGNNQYNQKHQRPNSTGDLVSPTPPAESVSRSVSGASSATLVAENNPDYIRDKKYEPPVIVTSPQYKQDGSKLFLKDGKVAPISHSESAASIKVECPRKDQLVTSTKTTQAAELSNTASETIAPSSQAFDPTQPAFVPEIARPRDPSNLYVKNLDDTFIYSTMDLKATFGRYGPIASAFLATYPNGASKGFGFVAFMNPTDAVRAKDCLDGSILGRKRVFVTFAERKEERSQRLKELFDSKKTETNSEPSARETKEEGSTGIKVAIQIRPPSPATRASEESKAHCTENITENGTNETSEAGSQPTDGEVTVTTTVTTTKAWKGTQLHGIVEVEEEESPCNKKFRQQRPQNHIQQSGGLGYKDLKTLQIPQNISPSNAKGTIPHHQQHHQNNHSPHSTGSQIEGLNVSPTPVQHRQRHSNVGTQQHSPSPRHGQRPFYLSGRGGAISPKPPGRRSDTLSVSPTPMPPGVPTGPRNQMNRHGSTGHNRDCTQKKKRSGKRGNGSTSPLGPDQDRDQGHLENHDNPRTSESRSLNSECSSDSATTTTKSEASETQSQP